ncbi:MAG: hypothetical protein M0Z66_15750 [Thermaerobacter sp.]|nr:hypothetical protein [Thermaerobacter sp.]
MDSLSRRKVAALYPAHLASLLPRRGIPGCDVIASDDLAAIAAAQPAVLGALYLPEERPTDLPPLYALGPALWQDPPAALVGRADQGQRQVAARALETLLGILGPGPLPPSPRGLRLKTLQSALGGGGVAIAGGGKVGRAVYTLAHQGKLRARLISDHKSAIANPVPWSRASDLFKGARAVLWASDRPLTPMLSHLPPEAVLVVLSALSSEERQGLLATLDGRAATALVLYRPLALPTHPGLVVLSDSPRRQALAMAQFLRHLQRHPG